MHYLVRQFMYSNSQCRGRGHRIQVNTSRNKIRYSAPDGTVFTIDCSDAGASGQPKVTSPKAQRYGCKHETHTLGDSGVCLASSIAGWELDHILLYCDSWAKGIGIYQRTGHFPKDPLAVFRSRR